MNPKNGAPMPAGLCDFKTEREIIRLIEDLGPVTGSQAWEKVGGDALTVWRTCRMSNRLRTRPVGTRYLRLDRRVEGFARLSPSIWREFLTYSIVGLSHDPAAMEQRRAALLEKIARISKAKLDLAYRVVCGLGNDLDRDGILEKELCFIIAGDIVYGMAHDVPRPERSTGKWVAGSDLDLVVIAVDDFPEHWMERLDDMIYREKYRLFMTPHLREEIDYVVKKMAKVREQMRFRTFKHMVACKILQEGTLLYGSERLFTAVKTLLKDKGVTERLHDLERKARAFRRHAEMLLMQEGLHEREIARLDLFYPSEESEEFE